MEKRRKHLDDIFQIALVLLGILSASEFQYYLAVESPEVFSYLLRVNTAPFIVLIGFWFVKEVFSDLLKDTQKMLLTEFCWDFLFFTLLYYLANLFGGFEFGLVASLILSLFMVFAITWAYSRTYSPTEGNMHKFYTNPIWLAIRYGVVFICGYILLVVIVLPWEFI